MSNFSIVAKLTSKGHEMEDLTEGTIEQLNAGMGAIARGAVGEWSRIARSRLNTSREIYIDGLRQAESFEATPADGGMMFEISLVGAMPNNIEFGMAPFDMKAVRPGWLGGGKAKIGKNGKRYVVIPFRHKTAPNQGGSQLSMTEDVGTVVKRVAKEYGLDKMKRNAMGNVVEGPVARVPNKAPVHPYLQGMVRIQKGQSGRTSTGLQKGSSSLVTFRIMSENSPADSWRHPGLRAANLLPEVEAWVDTQLDRLIEEILE